MRHTINIEDAEIEIARLKKENSILKKERDQYKNQVNKVAKILGNLMLSDPLEE